jgi:hypothetical protein
VPVTVLGRAGGDRLRIRVGERLAVDVGGDAMAEAFYGSLERWLGAPSGQPSEDAA